MTQYNELQRALEKANKPQPRPTVRVKLASKKEVFVSFDYENDRKYKRMLEAWNKNPKFEFVFQDHSSGEINSDNIGRVKAALTAKINNATHTLVIVGRYANSPHKDRALIGSRNWINFEIKQSKLAKNRIVAIKLNRLYNSPEELLGVNAKWAMSFTQEAILKALSSA